MTPPGYPPHPPRGESGTPLRTLSGERGTPHFQPMGRCLIFSAEHFLKLGFGVGVYVPLGGSVRPSGVFWGRLVGNMTSKVLCTLVTFYRSGVRSCFLVLGMS